MVKRIIIGISGASGAIYGIRLLEALRETDVETHLVISKMAHITLTTETPYLLAEVQAMADVVHNTKDLGASIASGSFKTMGMIVAPCSMRSLAEIATSLTTSLLTRAADVALKERRKLVLLVRESPLTTVHLRNMMTVSEMGGIIAPPVPAYYNKPETLDAIIRHTVGRTLDIFDIEMEGMTRWNGLSQ